MRILLCDDDQQILNQIRNLLETYFKKLSLPCPEIAAFTDGTALLADPGDRDIVFLDVEMPAKSGIDVGRELKATWPDCIIIIVTSYAEYLDEAMRFAVFRYLSKPLEEERFFRNLKDALEHYHSITLKVPVETKQGIALVLTSSIICVEAVGRKVLVHTSSQTLESTENMHFWLDKLPRNHFFQSHRSFIVNFGQVTDFDHNLITLNGGSHHAYLTRRKYSDFKAAYLLYLENTR